MSDITHAAVPLNTGASMPLLGLGVYELDDAQTRESVLAALDAGYRHIDTAAVYLNEAPVGAAVRESGLPREDVFVTTKLWNTFHENPREGLARSLDALGLDYVDLYLIHWPDSRQGRHLRAWEGLAELHADGLARSIGVSNFTPDQLDEVVALGGPVPAVNQIEVHPLHPQFEAQAHHEALGIVTQAWSPFARGKAFGLPDLEAIAAAHDRTPAQTILRWLIQRGISPLPRSSSPRRIAQNAALWDFELSAEAMARLSALASDVRVDSSLYERFQ